MSNKVLDFIYNFDVIGPRPKLFIFKKERYQNIFSLVISITIILASLAFILYSLINYIKNDTPTVIYSKSNDINEPREMYLKDMLMMFQITDKAFKKINDSYAHIESIHMEIYDNSTINYSALNIKKCNPRENLNIKYEKLFSEKFNELSEEIQEDKKIEDFYCIDSEDHNKRIFHYPNIGFSYIDLYIILHNQTEYKPENISIMIVCENNLINHDNKKSPISEGISYHFLQFFSSDEYYTSNLNFQYIKYETDDGLLLNSLRYLKGMFFLDNNYYKNNQHNYDLQNDFIQNNFSQIGTITLSLNKSNYDLYRRTYKKIQTLLAEIMSIVSLLFEIGGQIVAFINEKKMNIDIMSHLFKNLEKEKRIYKSNYKETVKITSEKLNNSFKLSEKNSICIEPSDNINEEIDSENSKILDKINIFHIIKSFACNGNRDKLITLCNERIIKDMCVETILERFYSLGTIYNLIIKEEDEKDNLSFYKEQRFKDINSIINDIINKIKIPKRKIDDKYKT